MSLFIQNGGKRLLQSDYERPEKTITETIQTKKDIEEQLINFEEIPHEDLCYVNLNTQLKYISYDKKNKKELFRFGGLLVKVEKEYVVLAGKEGMRFSVQRYTKNDKGDILHTTRFFKKMKDAEVIKLKLTDEIDEKDEEIKKQKSIIEKQKLELMAFKKKMGKLMK
jgi:hypothetical protein